MTTLQEVMMDVRLEATFGTVLFCDGDTSNAIRLATRTCLEECEGLVAFHTADCLRGDTPPPASILGGTGDEVRLYGDILGDPTAIARSSLCLQEQISSPACVAAVQSMLPNVAGLEYVGGLTTTPVVQQQPPTAVPAIAVPSMAPQTLSPTISPVTEKPVVARQTQSPVAGVNPIPPLTPTETSIPTAAPTLPSKLPSTTMLLTPQPSIASPTIALTRAPTPVLVTRPPVVRRTPAPSWMFTRRPSVAPVGVVPPQLPSLAMPTQQPSTSRPNAVTGNMFIPPPQPTATPTQQPSRLDEAGVVSMNQRQPTAVPSQQPEASPSLLGGGGNNETLIPLGMVILASLLVMTSSILFCIGLSALCKTRKKRRRAAAKRIQRDRRWDAERERFEHTLPLTRSPTTKTKRAEVSETENDCLSSVSSFHPSEYSSSSAADEHDDDDQWALYSVISGVSSAGVSRVSFACNSKQNKISAHYSS